VGLSFIAGLLPDTINFLKISEAINVLKIDQRTYIIGGHGPSPEPEYFLKKGQADIVVIGEGEETTVELLDSLKNSTPLELIKGIAFRNGDKVTINERRSLIKDIDSIPWPAYDLFPLKYID